MNDVQFLIKQLQDKGWSIVAISKELEVHWTAVARWKSGGRVPQTAASVCLHLETLSRRKRIPKQRRRK